MVAELKSLRKPAPRETLSERIRPHLETIAKRAAATEAARTVPAENIELIREAGFVRALLPAALGGDERDLWDYCDGVRTVTKACPSTGWVTGVLNIHQAAFGHFDPSVAKEILATGVDTIVCSSGSPQIKAKLAEGGILVTGRGRWSSGCDHAEWGDLAFCSTCSVPNSALRWWRRCREGFDRTGRQDQRRGPGRRGRGGRGRRGWGRRREAADFRRR